MKKTILSFAIGTSLLLVGCGSSSKSNNTEETVLKDPNYLPLSYTYDEGVDGIIDADATISYNTQNEIVEDIINVYINNRKTTSTKTYSYDENNNLSKEIENNFEGYINTTTYSYDNNHNLIKEIYESKEYNSSDLTIYTYDNANNRLTQDEDYNTNGTVNYYTNYSYNTKNLLIKEVISTSDKELLYSISYTYDTNDNLLSEIETDFDGEESASIYATYDNNNNLIKYIEIDYAKTKTTETFTYDENHRIVKVLELEDKHNNNIIDAQSQSNFIYKNNKYANLTIKFDDDNDGKFDDIIEAKYLLVAKKGTTTQQVKPLTTQKINQTKRVSKVVERFNKINPNFTFRRK